MKELEKKTTEFLDEINKDTFKILKIGNILPNLIRNFLIYKIASEISLEKKIYEIEIKKFYLKNNILNYKDLESFLRIKGIAEEELHYQITLPLKISKFAEQNFREEIKSYFLERKDYLDEYTFNIIRVKNKDLAYELYFRIDSEESDFIKPKIANKLIIASVGELILPFQVDEWWILLKLIGKKNAKFDEHTSNMLLKEIFNKFINNLVANFTADYLKLETNDR